jgi:RNA polymerase sigma factor (sigma-70 family)
MKSNDVELIQRTLAGDETAFASLIEKYQRQVHTHALRQIGDFHIAEDITQETFLRVYQNLKTLNDPTQFSRWLHAIVNHLCIAWHRKNRMQTESLEETHISETEREAYSRYVASEHEKISADAQRDLVERLLAKLKESDREVITLHYFEEMTSSEIGTFLGVSENTIKSRLHRARQRLKKYASMIQEVLDITIKRKHHSQTQMEGEIKMAEEMRDEAKTEARLKELQRQIANLQEEIKVIAVESGVFHPDNMKFLDPEKSEAIRTLCRLPDSDERVIAWGYVGGYRTSPGKTNARVAFWGDNIDSFLTKAPATEIVNLASLFTNPTIVAVLRQLVEGKRSVADLAKGCGISESEIEKAVQTLMDATLVARTENDLIEPKNDVVSFFLNFVSMTIVHLGHIKSEN